MVRGYKVYKGDVQIWVSYIYGKIVSRNSVRHDVWIFFAKYYGMCYNNGYRYFFEDRASVLKPMRISCKRNVEYYQIGFPDGPVHFQSY